MKLRKWNTCQLKYRPPAILGIFSNKIIVFRKTLGSSKKYLLNFHIKILKIWNYVEFLYFSWPYF